MPDKKLKSTGITLDGTPIALRPLLPEDEPALQDLFAHMRDFGVAQAKVSG
jgi:hypothetical protein